MASCLKAGLISDNQILKAYEWAIQNNNFRNDKYDELAKSISAQFQTKCHNDWRIRISIKRHTCTIISKKPIFDHNQLRDRAKKIFSIGDKNQFKYLRKIKI